MIKFVFQTDKGPIGVFGINAENLRRLKAGMPLDIDVKQITPPGKRINRIFVHYADTYEDVVKDMQEGGLPVPDEFLDRAKRMDEAIQKEKS